MTEENTNMELWNRVCETNPAHAKSAKVGKREITTVNPQQQRRNATDVFGPYGIGWGIVPGSEVHDIIDCGDTKLCVYSATMFYILNSERGEFPITSTIKVSYVTNQGQGYLLVDDEFAKKAQTDALTKGLSFLGFNADIFLGFWDDNRYVNQMEEKFNPSE